MTTETKVRQLTDALQEARDTIREQEEALEALTRPPLPYATVVEKHEKANTMMIATPSGMVEVGIPKFPVKAGDTITITAMTSQAVQAQLMPPVGETAMVRSLMSDGTIEVDYQDKTKLVFRGEGLSKAIEKGDKVVLDRTTSVIVRNMGKDTVQFNVTDDLNVQWDDIGGLEDAKESLVEAIELPHRYPELYAFYHKRQTKGILLYGAAGCGKTMLGKATATSLKVIYKTESNAGFIYVKAPEILNKYVGNSEATIRQLFQRATDFRQEYGYPAVLFIDEADAILSKRGSGKSSDMEETIVPMFLSEMDGLNQSDAIVLLATNRIDRLDNAVIREGRIDYKIRITRPNKHNARAIFQVHLRNLPIAPKDSLDSLTDMACEELFSKERHLYHIKTNKYGELPFCLFHVISGSMVANVVDRATMIALLRDIKGSKQTGISSSDIKQAVDGVYRSNLDVDYRDDIMDFTLGFRDDVLSVEKAKA